VKSLSDCLLVGFYAGVALVTALEFWEDCGLFESLMCGIVWPVWFGMVLAHEGRRIRKEIRRRTVESVASE